MKVLDLHILAMLQYCGLTQSLVPASLGSRTVRAVVLGSSPPIMETGFVLGVRNECVGCYAELVDFVQCLLVLRAHGHKESSGGLSRSRAILTTIVDHVAGFGWKG